MPDESLSIETQGCLQRQDDVRLRHTEDRALGEGFVFDEQVEQRVDRVFIPHVLGDLRKPLALQRHQLGILRPTAIITSPAVQ